MFENVVVGVGGYQAGRAALERIGVACDETPESDQALAVARKLAARSHASLSAYEAIGRPVYARDIWNVERDVDRKQDDGGSPVGARSSRGAGQASLSARREFHLASGPRSRELRDDRSPG